MKQMAQEEVESKAPPTQDLTTIGDLTLTTETINGLANISEPMFSLVIWQRKIPHSVKTWVSEQQPEQLPSGRVLTDRHNIREAIKTFFLKNKHNEQNEQQWLANDIVQLAQKYADITGSNKIDIRLDVIQNDACWKFHLDRVDYRLVTTYKGEGTQYVSPENAEQALNEQTDYSGPIKKIVEQNVAIFKGSNNTCGRGIVHRSPPIKEKQETRLLLCINARSEVSPNLWSS
jgi:hypothetical protein